MITTESIKGCKVQPFIVGFSLIAGRFQKSRSITFLQLSLIACCLFLDPVNVCEIYTCYIQKTF